MKKPFLLLGLTLLLTVSVRAQADLDIKNYTAEDGVMSFSETTTDKQGYTWFWPVSGSEEGIYKYDGRQFSEFRCGSRATVIRYEISATYGGEDHFVRDRNGAVWFGTTKGVYKCVAGKPVLMFSTKNGLAADSVVSLKFDALDNLWILTTAEVAVAGNHKGKYTLSKIPAAYSINIAQVKKNIPAKAKKGVRVFLKSDKDGNVWWGVRTSYDSLVRIYRTRDYFPVQRKISTFTVRGPIHRLTPLNHGALLSVHKKPYIFCDTLGHLSYLDKKFKVYVGTDLHDNHYFATMPEEDRYVIYRDKPRNLWEFGSSASVFVFPPVPFYPHASSMVGDELWIYNRLMNWNMGKAIRKNSMLRLDSLYPAIVGDNMQFHNAGERVVWGHKWQNQFSSQLMFSASSTLYSMGENVNGSSIIDYSPDDSVFYYLLSVFEEQPNIVSSGNGIVKNLSTHISNRNARSQNGHVWFYSDAEKIFVHAGRVDHEEVYPTAPIQAFALYKNGESCFVLTGQTLHYLSNGKDQTVPLPASLQLKAIYTGSANEIYLHTSNEKLLSWEPFNKKDPVEVKGLPDGEITDVFRSGQKFFFKKGNTTIWMHQGKFLAADTSMDVVPLSMAAKADSRYYFYRKKEVKGSLKNIYTYEQGQYKKIPLADSVVFDQMNIAQVYGNSDELIYCSGTKIYRYDKKLGRFYFIKNAGRTFGYIWTPVVIGNKLHITGWSKSHLVINLDECPVTFPALSFSVFRNNGKELPAANKFTVAYGDEFSVSYMAIESFNQSKIVYQTRIIGRDSAWTEPTKNEIKEFTNLPAGNYRFEVRARGDSEIWSAAIGFDFVVLAPWYGTTAAYIVYLVLFVLLIWLLVKLNTRRLKKANRKLQERIDRATNDIRHQKEIIEEKHKEITDSINYAERIQRSFLATKELLNQNLPRHFVLFKPKDVVSGDFYWAGETFEDLKKLNDSNPQILKSSNAQHSNDQIFFLAVADSTGHGVPGAIMSILNITCLENAVKEGLAEPKDILNHTRRNIIERLKKDGSAGGGKDGMDCSLLRFDFQNNKLVFALANNPLWLIRNNEWIEYEPDKMPVGKHDKDTVSFTQQEIDLQKGDLIYIFTDGYPDQFGGPKGKKFKYKNLGNLLLAHHQKEMAEQKEILATGFDQWKGDLEQVDDVCIMGIGI